MVSVHVREETVEAVRGGSLVTNGVAGGGYVLTAGTARKRRVSSYGLTVELLERNKCTVGLVKSPVIRGGEKLHLSLVPHEEEE